MLKNYFLIGFRNLAKNYLYMSANLVGLSFGIACSILAYFIWEFHNNFDGIHSKSESIYRVQTVRSDDQELYSYGTTPLPLAKHITGIKGLVATARYNIHNEVIKKDETVLNQQIAYVDPEFTEIFDFPVYSGTSTLTDPNSAILTYNSAIQFFGDDEVLGKTLQLQTVEGLQLFTITGVMKNHLLNSSFKFDILLNYERYLDNYEIEEDNWGIFSHATFVELSYGFLPEEFSNQIQTFIPVFNNAREDWVAEEFTLVNLEDMSMVSRNIRGNYLGYNNPEGAVMIPVIMAVIILLVACFNYMNTSISLSSTRLKEIGVRKAIGASRGQLITQMLTENILLLFVALAGGLLLVEFLAPAYNRLGPWVEIIPSYRNNIGAVSYLIVLLLITALLSGAYPAFYVSKFQTTQIFNGRLKLKSSGTLSKVLMVLQLAFSLISLIQGIVYVQNTKLQERFDLGYNKHGIITVPIKRDQFNVFKESISSHTTINMVAGTRHHVGYGMTSSTIESEGQKEEVRVLEVGPEYLQTMGMELNQGRYFNPDSEEDQSTSVIVNPFFIDAFRIADAADHRILIDEKPYHIIGIVKEFYPYGLWRSENEIPMLLKLSQEKDFSFLVANVSGDIKDTDKYLKKTWLKQFPNAPYESDLINMHIERSELLSANMGTMNIFMAIVALFLSATGLFTLISINVQKRMKEIGLRKVMGASSWNIIKLVNKGYFFIIFISLVVGCSMGAYLTEMFLDLMFSIHAHPGPLALGITSVVVIVILLLTGSLRVLKAAQTNPVETLKMEN